MPCGHNDFAAAVDAGIERIRARAQHSKGDHDHQHKRSTQPVTAYANEQTQDPNGGPGDCRKRGVQADDQQQGNASTHRSHPKSRRPLP